MLNLLAASVSLDEVEKCLDRAGAAVVVWKRGVLNFCECFRQLEAFESVWRLEVEELILNFKI